MKIKPENILVVRTDRIGDVVLTLPLASVLKKYFPGCRTNFLLREYTLPLAGGNKFIDEVLELKIKNGAPLLIENIRLLRNKNFDTCFVVSPNFKLALILRLSGIKNIVGTGYRWYSFLFNHKIFEHRKYAEHHELEFNIRMLRPFNIDADVNKENVEFGIQINEQSDLKARQFLENINHDFSKKTVVVHPGSGGSAIDWPLERFKDLLKLLAQQLDINIILTGSAVEKVLCENLVCDSRIKNLAGEFELDYFISLLNLCDLMIANSTGPLHIAAALGKQVVAFYPKIVASSKERWGPYTNRAKVFNPNLQCKNCTRKQCEELDCMNTIEPEKVFESVKTMLGL